MQYLPWLLFGLMAGSVADRHDRRRLVMIADGAACASSCWGWSSPGHRPRDRLDRAGHGVPLRHRRGVRQHRRGDADADARQAGRPRRGQRAAAGGVPRRQPADRPPLGAFLFAAGPFWPFVTQRLSASASRSSSFSRIAPTPIPPRRCSAAATRTAAPHPRGLHWLRGNPPVRTLVLIILVFNVTWAAPWSILVLYATKHLGLGAVGYGALTTAAALGGLVGLRLRLARAARVSSRP